MTILAQCPCGLGGCDGKLALHFMRLEGQAKQRQLTKVAELDQRKAALEEKELADRERRQAAIDRIRDAADAERGQGDGLAVGDTLADFEREVSLSSIIDLPSAFERMDGATLLYEGLDNTIYGEMSIGKSWLALMVAIQRLRAGARVLWLDAEDKPATLARRLQLLKATNFIGHPDLKWVTGDLTASASAMSEALDYLAGGAVPGLVIIDSATSFECPADGSTVRPWMAAHIKPFTAQDHTTILLDHVPKQRKDRPPGPVGSYQKNQDLQGAAVYVHGQPWNRQQGGYLTLNNQKDRHGQLPAVRYDDAATIYVEHSEDMLTLDWSVGLPNVKPEGEDLEDELLEAIGQAGTVKGSRELRGLLKGKRARDIDSARNELESAGLIQHVKVGNTHVYTVVK